MKKQTIFVEGNLKRLFGLSLLIVLALSFSAFGQRKLPAKAYLSSAKIDVIEGRPEEAVAMLDSLFMYYGPHSEGLALMSQIYVDMIAKASTAHEKAPHVDKLMAYVDSLHMCCENEKIDNKNRKDCDKLIPQVDTSAVQFWREFFNKGLEQLATLQEFATELSNAQDSQTIEFFTKAVASKADTSIMNMQLALKIDSTDHRPYIAIGSILEGEKKYEEAISWFVKGLNFVEDSSSMLLSIAYNYINIDKYCDAIPYFEAYFRLIPTDLANANNLTICYIRCEQDDKAIETYKRMLTVDSVHSGALLGLANYLRRDATELIKQSRLLTDEKKQAESKALREKGNKIFDSASAYYERYITAYPDSISGYDEYGLINYILGRYDKAIVAFKKLTELQPKKVESWISLGDSYFSLNDFPNAIPAYEKAVELGPDNKEIWERLSFLYAETGKTNKKDEADKKLKALN